MRRLGGLGPIGSAIQDRPWLIVLAGAVISAVAFPGAGAGALGLVMIAGFAGVGFVRLWPRLAKLESRSRPGVPPRLAGWIAIGVVVLTSVYVFVPVFERKLQWVGGDWGPQHVVLRGVVDHLRDWELPRWNHLISTGDPSLDVYPSLTYVIAGAFAIVTGLEDRLPLVLVLVAVITHTFIAIGATRLALRFLPPALAALIGVLLVIDLDGVLGTIKVGLLHTAVAQVFSLAAMVAVADALQRPRLGKSLAIWLWTALATAAHPSGLLATLVMVFALAIVAGLARDLPPRRALAAIAHLMIGTMLAAVVWLPLGERIMLYGQHFSDVLADPAHWFTGLFREPSSYDTVGLAVFFGYAGAIGGLWSRRALPILVAATVVVLVVAQVDAPYLAFDLAPSRFTARLGSSRFAVLLRPLIAVAAGYLVSILVDHIRSRWHGADARSLLVGSFIAGIMACGAARFGCQSANLQISQVRQHARWPSHDAPALFSWAREQVADSGPGRWGRAYFVEGNALHHTVTALTGLPAFHPGPIPDVLLRERIEALDAESFRRFNVRWLVSAQLDSPMPLGDPATERAIAGFRIQQVAGWDGQFARVERGHGRAIVTRLDANQVDVELRDTTEPALVALGTGYYPRWRATTADGRSVPVYAFPATSHGQSHVVAAWLPPGKTSFTPDGPLPSDGKGRAIGLIGLALAIAIICVWSRRHTRLRALRLLARLRTVRASRHTRLLVASLTAFALVIWGAAASHAPARVLELGGGVRGQAEVSIKGTDDTWQSCEYVRTLGEFHCGNRAIVRDASSALVNDQSIGWPYTTPAIAAAGQQGGIVQLRIVLRRRLSGRYWLASSVANAEIAISGRETLTTDHQHVVELDDAERTITITLPPAAFPTVTTFVREDTLLPDYRAPSPPATAPF